MTLSLAAAILALLTANHGLAQNDRQDGPAAGASIVHTTNQGVLDGLWKNVRFGLPRIPRAPGW